MRQNEASLPGYRLVLFFLLILMSGCRTYPESTGGGTSDGPGIAITETEDDSYRLTLQADIASTAEELARSTLQPAETTVPDTDLESTRVPGDPLASRTGPCPQPEGFVVQYRLGFCLATPADWVVANVDGGLAATLNTTPGQAISIQPASAESTAVCNLMIYLAAEMSPEGHLKTRHAEFEQQPGTTALADIAMRSLGSLALPGFTWEMGSTSGAVYADVVGPGRIAHISFSGTDCPADELFPVLDTLRFNSSEL